MLFTRALMFFPLGLSSYVIQGKLLRKSRKKSLRWKGRWPFLGKSNTARMTNISAAPVTGKNIALKAF